MIDQAGDVVVKDLCFHLDPLAIVKFRGDGGENLLCRVIGTRSSPELEDELLRVGGCGGGKTITGTGVVYKKDQPVGSAKMLNRRLKIVRRGRRLAQQFRSLLHEMG